MNPLLTTYNTLMQQLSNLPDACANLQAELSSAQQRKRDAQRLLDDLEAKNIQSAGGYKSLGSNEKERELAASQLHQNFPAWRQRAAELRAAELQVAQCADELAAAERQYGAVAMQSRLHAALLTYLGNSGVPAPTAEPNFWQPGQATTTTAGNGSVTLADAAALGL